MERQYEKFDTVFAVFTGRSNLYGSYVRLENGDLGFCYNAFQKPGTAAWVSIVNPERLSVRMDKVLDVENIA